MNYRKNMFALLVAGTLITGCGGGGTDISGGSSGSSGLNCFSLIFNNNV
jgi:hypothetical protein